MKEVLGECKWEVLLVSVLNVISALCMAITTYLTASLLDAAVGGNEQAVLSQILWLLVAYGITLAMDYVTCVVEAKTLMRLNQVLREKMLKNVTSLSYQAFNATDSGKYLSWFSNDVTQIETNGFKNVFQILGNVATIVFTSIGLCYIHYLVFIIALVFSGIMFLLPKVVGRQMTKKSEAVSAAQDKFMARSKDYLAGFEVLYSHNVVSNLKQVISEESKTLENTRYLFKTYEFKTMTLIGGGRVVFQIAMIGMTALLVAVKVTTIGVIFPVTEYSGRLFSSISGLISRVMLIKSTKPLFDKYERLPSNSKRNKHAFKKVIRIENVSFSYEDKAVLSKLNLRFEKGKKYAIIGQSGSGKTTLVKLLMNQLTEYEGDISMDHVPIHSIEMSDQIAYIGQEIHLFSESILDNLTLKQSFTDSEISKAIESSGLKSVIEQLPAHEKTILTENGNNLSGGQKQRVAIARALLRKKPIIILDEGTSALDRTNAYEIESKLLQNKELTVVMITHHLHDKLIDYYDEVIDLGAKYEVSLSC